MKKHFITFMLAFLTLDFCRIQTALVAAVSEEEDVLAADQEIIPKEESGDAIWIKALEAKIKRVQRIKNFLLGFSIAASLAVGVSVFIAKERAKEIAFLQGENTLLKANILTFTSLFKEVPLQAEPKDDASGPGLSISSIVGSGLNYLWDSLITQDGIVPDGLLRSF